MTTRNHVFALILVAAGCSSPSSDEASARRRGAPASPSGVDLAGMDRAVAPGDDFFAYANGAWIKTTRDPADRSSCGIGADAGRAHRPSAPPTLIADAPKATRRAGSDARKIGDYYASFMDEAAIEAKGLAPLQPTLDAHRRHQRRRPRWRASSARRCAPTSTCSTTRNFDTDNLFGLWVAQDLDDPTRYSPFLLQGGLGMPDRDYYLDPSPRMADDPREVPGARRRAARRSPASPTRDAKAQRIFDARDSKIAAGARDARRDRGRAEGQQPLGARRLRRSARRASTGRRSSRAAGLDKQATFVVWQPSAITGDRRAGAQSSRWRRGRTT